MKTLLMFYIIFHVVASLSVAIHIPKEQCSKMIKDNSLTSSPLTWWISDGCMIKFIVSDVILNKDNE
ncbi:MAG: hypothetical protein COB41_00170 [Proteobacteria bacterium]|nr:MAG: hypothetical protein COB41_00170 [Pseudomonadota bacterium]